MPLQREGEEEPCVKGEGRDRQDTLGQGEASQLVQLARVENCSDKLRRLLQQL